MFLAFKPSSFDVLFCFFSQRCQDHTRASNFDTTGRWGGNAKIHKADDRKEDPKEDLKEDVKDDGPEIDHLGRLREGQEGQMVLDVEGFLGLGPEQGGRIDINGGRIGRRICGRGVGGMGEGAAGPFGQVPQCPGHCRVQDRGGRSPRLLPKSGGNEGPDFCHHELPMPWGSQQNVGVCRWLEGHLPTEQPQPHHASEEVGHVQGWVAPCLQLVHITYNKLTFKHIYINQLKKNWKHKRGNWWQSIQFLQSRLIIQRLSGGRTWWTRSAPSSAPTGGRNGC